MADTSAVLCSQCMSRLSSSPFRPFPAQPPQSPELPPVQWPGQRRVIRRPRERPSAKVFRYETFLLELEDSVSQGCLLCTEVLALAMGELGEG